MNGDFDGKKLERKVIVNMTKIESCVKKNMSVSGSNSENTFMCASRLESQ